LLKEFFNAGLRVLGKQGAKSNCGLCGKDDGGSDIVVPLEIMERARKADNPQSTPCSHVWGYGFIFRVCEKCGYVDSSE
jgi:hypothetical protein